MHSFTVYESSSCEVQVCRGYELLAGLLLLLYCVTASSFLAAV